MAAKREQRRIMVYLESKSSGLDRGFKQQNGTTTLLSRFRLCVLQIVLDHNNVLSLRTFLSLHEVELYALAFFQVAVAAIVSQGAVMHENIRTFCTFNETVAFATIEPLHCALYSFRHDLELLSFRILPSQAWVPNQKSHSLY
jgi:hypothetical protein